MCRSQICRINRTVFLQQLGKTQFQRIAGLPLYFHAKPTNHILSHIQNIYSGSRFGNTDRFHGIHHFHITIELGLQLSSRQAYNFCLKPLRIIKRICIPSRHLFSCIILFTVKLIICPDGTFGRYFPGSIARNHPFLSIFIVYLKLGNHFRYIKMPHSRHTHRSIPSVAQDDTDGISSL